MPNISPPIWALMHLSCRFSCGKHSFQSSIAFFESDENFLPFQIHHEQRLPFNWKCPSGYLIAIVLQWISLTYVFFTIMILLSCGIAGYCFAIAVTEDIKCTLNIIEENVKTKVGRRRINRQFAEFIESHAAIKQLSCVRMNENGKIAKLKKVLFTFFRTVTEFSNLYQPIFMVLFSHSLLITCCAMLLIQIELVECM